MKKSSKNGSKSLASPSLKNRSPISAKTSTNSPEYDRRYAPNYKAICAFAHRSTGGLCCCCLTAPSEEIHHAYYQDQWGAIAGREVPGESIFGVCKVCHDSQCHSKANWIVDHKNPVLGNRNTPEWIFRLKFGYTLLVEANGHL